MRYTALWRGVGVVTLAALTVGPTPAQGGRSVPVNVVNLPDVQMVSEINTPAFDPAQMFVSQTTTIEFPNTVLATGAYLPAVPAGKRFVVQHFSMYMQSEAIDADPACSARIRPVSSPATTTFRHRFPTEREFTGTRETAVFSSPMVMYVDENMQVGASCTVRVSADTYLEVSVSGYYVDL